MPLFRRPIPRRAFWGAALGAFYSLLLVGAALRTGSGVGVAMAAAWLLLAVGVLFLHPLAYHAYTAWAILWVAWRSVAFWREGGAPALQWFLNDLLLPLASLLLLVGSGYLEAAREAREPEE